MDNEYIQLGSIAAIFIIAIREFFNYLKAKKNGNGEMITADIKVFEELKRMNNNHLHSIESAIIEGNKEIVRSINDGNLRTIQLLGEIKGNLIGK